MPSRNYCLNCESPMPEDFGYCQHCGQKKRDGVPTVRELLRETFSSIFNVDNRIFRTLRDLYRPAKLAQAYVAGRTKYYLHPIRLYIVSLFLLLAFIFYAAPLENKDLTNSNPYATDEQNSIKRAFVKVIDSLGQQVDTSVVAVLATSMFDDSLKISADTLAKGDNVQVFGMHKAAAKYKIPMHDALYLSHDDLVEKYDIKGLDRVRVRQYIKIKTDLAGQISVLIKNGVWAILLTIIIISAFLKLIYIRGRYYYVEHVVNQLYLHSFYFIGLLVVLLVAEFEHILGADTDLFLLLIFPLVGMVFFNFLRYYQQGLWKTLIKVGMYLFSYLFIVLFCLGLVAYISLFIN